MKTLIFLTIGFLSYQTSAQTNEISLGGCGKETPRLCINDPVYLGGAFGKVVGFSPDGRYTFQYVGGSYHGSVEANKKSEDLYRATEGKCGATTPRLCVGEPVYLGGAFGKIAGFNPAGKYVFKYVGGSYNGSTETDKNPAELYRATQGKCGATTPRYCVGESVYMNSADGIIVGFNALGNYVFKYGSGSYKGSTEPGKDVQNLTKIRNSSSSGLTCEAVDVTLSDLPAEVLNTYLALAKVTTAERSAYLTEISQYLVAQNQAEATLFARLVFSKIVKSSTAKVVKDNFAKPVEDDLKELEKIGWKSVDQIEAKGSTLDFATRILAAGVKLRMSMPDANHSLASFRSRLAATVAEPKLSVKITALQGIVKDMEPLLLDLMQDPRHGALGEVTQDVAGWILKN